MTTDYTRLITLLLAINCTGVTALPILGFYPRCDYKITDSIEAVVKQGSSKKTADAQRLDVLQQTIHQLQQKADGKGDALIISKVHGQLNEDQLAFSNNKDAEIDIIYRVTADIITLCKENISLAARQTRYNAQGLRQLEAQTEQRTEIDISFTTSFSGKSKIATVIADANISLQSGFHGIQLGINRQQLEALLGSPSKVFNHVDGSQTLGFNNQLWLTLNDNKLVKASHSFDQLNYDLISKFNDEHQATLSNWQLAEKFRKGALLQDVKAEFGEQLNAIATLQYVLQQDAIQLVLGFNGYDDIHSDKRQIKLASVRMQDASFKSASPIQYPSFDNVNQLAALSSTLSNKAWQDNLARLETNNYVVLEQDQRLHLIQPELAITYKDETIQEVHFALLMQSANLPRLQQLLRQFNLPQTRAAFMQQHKDAFESNGKLVVYADLLEINARYNDDDIIDSFQLRWY